MRALLRGPAAAALGASIALSLALPAGAAAAAPNLTSAGRFLTSPKHLIDGHYYEAFAGFADFGLTIDGALALAASGTNDVALKKIVSFLNHDGKDSGGQTINAWTGVGTADVSGGALGKEALLAQVTGYDPISFGGHNVLTALNASLCTKPIVNVCAAAGNYRYTTSVFAQSLAVIAQLRAHRMAQAAKPLAYLESLQKAGAWPSVLPAADGAKPDADSTAVAVMALNLVGDAKAKAAVKAGLAWLAAQQSAKGGFPGVEANSTNSTGLAVQALSLAGSTYAKRIASARAYLAIRQNSDGGFDVSAATNGSDVRASTQAAGGTVGTSFGTLTHDVSRLAAPTPKPTATTTAASPTTVHTSTTPPSTPLPVSTSPPVSRTPPISTTSRTSTTVHNATTSRTSTTVHTATTAASATPTRTTSATAPSTRMSAASDSASVAGIPKRTSSSAPAAASSGESLANTGAHTSALARTAALLLAVGAALTVAGRRRRPVAHRRHR